MPFKTNTQPLCRHCGRAIAKHTERFRFGPFGRWVGDGARRDIYPKSKAEAQHFVNGQIVSVRWMTKRGSNDTSDSAYDRTTPDYIDDVATWDGETYVDEFFCCEAHATLFAYSILRQHDLAMPAYDTALKERLRAKESS